MKIIEPSVELWKQENDIAHAVRCARVCYKRESGNDEATYKRLIESKHYSVFRHASYYYIINKNKGYHKIIDSFIDVVDNGLKLVGIDIKHDKTDIYIVVNGQFILEHPSFITAISKYQVDEDIFKNTEIGFKGGVRYFFDPPINGNPGIESFVKAYQQKKLKEIETFDYQYKYALEWIKIKKKFK